MMDHGDVPRPVVVPGRLAASLDKLATFTEPDRPWSRTAFSDQHRAGRAWLRAEMQAIDLEVSIDAGGNLIGHLPGRDRARPSLATGSHSDTVPSGGRFDGALGLMAGLEVVRSLRDAGASLRHGLDVIDFLAEEPNRFGISCVGSRALAGQLSPAQLARTGGDTATLADGIRGMGGDPDRLLAPLRAPGALAAFVELHIEQARQLEAAGEDIGIVTGIVGITRAAVEVLGRADHAGATPMDLRQDALVAASHMVAAVEAIASRRSAGGDLVVATVGKFDVEPNAANVVPGRVRFILEVRAGEDAIARGCLEEALAMMRAVARERGATVSHDVLGSSSAVAMDARVQDAIAAAAWRSGARFRRMPSGAGHDAAYMARLGPSGMIFIPCKDGRSHCPEEFSDDSQNAIGTQVLLNTLIELDQSIF